MRTKIFPSGTYDERLIRYLSKIAKVQILTRDKKFKKKIRDFRRNWEIPIRGFRNKKKLDKWLRNPPQKLSNKPKGVKITEEEIIYLDGKKYSSLIKEIKKAKNFKIERAFGNFPVQTFYVALKKFMTENNIDEVLGNVFRHYVYYDTLRGTQFPKPAVEVSELVFTGSHNEIISRQVCLKFGPNTRKEDIDVVFNSGILPIQKTLPGYLKCKPRQKRFS